MRKAEKEIKEFQTRIPLILDPGEQITKKKQQKNSKNQRTTIRHYFQPNRDETGREREKTILDPNSAHTRPGGENCKKKTAKKFKKLRNNFPALVLAKKGLDRMKQAKKEIKEC